MNIEQKDINYIIEVHRDHARKPKKAFRKWNGKTPYYIHPIWCTTTLATETTLDDKTRTEGTQTLLYHDVPEDTTKQLPKWINNRVRLLIQWMTYDGMPHEIREVWSKPPEIRLYKLYDKINNLLDWQESSKITRNEYEDYTRGLLEDVLRNYGELNITKIARAILRNRISYPK